MGGGGSIIQRTFIREEHLNQFYQRRGGVYYIRGVYLEVGIYEVIYGSQLVSAINSASLCDPRAMRMWKKNLTFARKES